MKRMLLAIGSLGMIALLTIMAIGGIASAQTPGNVSTPKREVYLDALATRLGISTESLQTAIQETSDQLNVGPGHFGDRIRSLVGKRHERTLNRLDLTQAATFLGISSDELKTELQNDKTFLEIAQQHEKTFDDVRSFLIQQATVAIDEHLQTPVDEAANSNAAA